MAKTSFVRAPEAAPAGEAEEQGGGTAVEEAPPAPQAVAVREDRTVAAPDNNRAQVEGDIDPGDLNMDRVNLVNKSGKLGDQFEPGSFVLGKEVILSKKGETFTFAVLAIKKSFQQDLPYDSSGTGPQPERYKTAEEVRAAGGHLVYDKKADGRYFHDVATALILIPAPAGITEDERDNKFIYESPDGKYYALALWTLTKTSYTAVAKKIFTAGVIGHLKTGLYKGMWTVGSELKSNPTNSWFQPVLKPSGKTTEEFQAFAKEVLTTLA